MACILSSPELGGHPGLQRIADELALPLKRWATGVEVQKVQRALRALDPHCDLGHSFDRAGADHHPPDGVYGEKTWLAVKALQQRWFPTHPEWQTGFTGTVTLCAMDRMLLQRAQAGSAQAPAPPPVGAPVLADGELEALRLKIVGGPLQYAVAPGVTRDQVGPVHLVAMDEGRVRLGVVWRVPGRDPGGQMAAIGSIRGWVSSFHPLVAVSGSFADIYSNPLAPIPLSGSVVVSGRRTPSSWSLADGDRFDRFQGQIHGAFVAYVAQGAGRQWRFGIGRVPREASTGGHVTSGLDGLVPMILTNGAGRKVYDTTDPWYRQIQHRGATGLVVLAHLPQAHRLVLLVQPDDGATHSIDDLRDLAAAAGCHHAVALDGSDSAMLLCGATWLVENASHKDQLNPNSVAFFTA